MKTLLPLLVVLWSCVGSLAAVELPPELPLWKTPPADHVIQHAVDEQVRTAPARDGAPSGSNRVFSHVSQPTYCIHRPEKPNGVGLVICPGGGYRDVWLDREGHDLAIWLKDYGITSLVLKYRTNTPDKDGRMVYAWDEYLPAVEADARQAIRILRESAADLGLQPDRIGICGFSAGGNLALLATLYSEPKQPQPQTSGMPDFTGLFYPWFRDDYGDDLARRSAEESPVRPVGPVFMMNAQDDRVTPPEKCVAFYQQLLAAGVKAELHIYTRGSHGFDLGVGRGESTAMWPASFIAFLRDVKIMP